MHYDESYIGCDEIPSQTDRSYKRYDDKIPSSCSRKVRFWGFMVDNLVRAFPLQAEERIQ